MAQFGLEGGDSGVAGRLRGASVAARWPAAATSAGGCWCQTVRQRTQRTERPAAPIAEALT